jgi:hypothetical protein
MGSDVLAASLTFPQPTDRVASFLAIDYLQLAATASTFHAIQSPVSL